MDSADGPEAIADERARAALRHRAIGIQLQSLALGLLLAMVSVVLP